MDENIQQILNNALSPAAQQISAPTDPLAEITNSVGVSLPDSAPDDVTAAQQQTGSNDFNGLCQAFVEQVTHGHTGIYPSAIAAWQAQQDKAKPGIDGAKPGDAVYFTPNDSNQGSGHTGIYLGNNHFISATDNGVMPYDLNDWYKQTGQHVMGYIPREKMRD